MLVVMWPWRHRSRHAPETDPPARSLTRGRRLVLAAGGLGALAVLGGPLAPGTACAGATRASLPAAAVVAHAGHVTRLPPRGVPYLQVLRLAPQLQAGADPALDAAAGHTSARPGPPARRLPADAGTIVQVRPGQSVELRRSPGGRVIERFGARSDTGSRPRSFTVYAVSAGRWLGVSVPILGGRLGWIAANPAHVFVHAALNEIVVSLRLRRLVLFQGRRMVLSTPVVIGGSDSPTPTGHFSVDDVVHYRPASPEYGIGALALSVPPRGRNWVYWRVAIHGLNNLGTLGGTGSLGCVHVPTPDLRRLLRVPVGTPVDIVT